MTTINLLPGEALALRTCNADMTSPSPDANGFKWPSSGPVSCEDWEGTNCCGNGLHGLLYGCGDAGNLYQSEGNVYMLFKVQIADWVDLGSKGKAPRGEVVFVGSREDAVRILADTYPDKPVVYASRTSGDRGTSTSGDRGTSTSGDWGTSTSGDWGTSTSGYGGTSTSGYGGTSTSGYGGTSTSGYGGTSTSGYGGTSTSGDRGTSTSGDRGTSTSGDRGTSTSGDWGTSTSGYGGTSTSGYGGTSTSGYGGTSTSGYGGTSTSGYGGTSTSGDRGTSTSGDWGTSTSGYGGTLIIKWYDIKANRYRLAVGYVGENGIKPNVKYKLNEKHEFVEAE